LEANKFPEFPDTFPAHRVKFADFGQNLQKSRPHVENSLLNSLLAGNWQTEIEYQLFSPASGEQTIATLQPGALVQTSPTARWNWANCQRRFRPGRGMSFACKASETA
jgi:hypothetical protein